jgi:hypothetical protein
MASALGPLIPIPKELIKDEPALLAEYESLEKDPVALLAKFRWWSLHDLMTIYHSGLIPKENSANYLNFSVDFSSEEMERAKLTDPTLGKNLDAALRPLQQITMAVQQEMMNIQRADANTLNQNALARSRAPPAYGGKSKKDKKKLKGGDFFNSAAPPEAPMQQAPMQQAPMQQAPMQQAPMQQTQPQEPIYSAENIEKECMKDLATLPLTSKSRIFITDGRLPTKNFGGGGTRRRKRGTKRGNKNGTKKVKTRHYRQSRRKYKV